MLIARKHSSPAAPGCTLHSAGEPLRRRMPPRLLLPACVSMHTIRACAEAGRLISRHEQNHEAPARSQHGFAKLECCLQLAGGRGASRRCALKHARQSTINRPRLAHPLTWPIGPHNCCRPCMGGAALLGAPPAVGWAAGGGRRRLFEGGLAPRLPRRATRCT